LLWPSKIFQKGWSGSSGKCAYPTNVRPWVWTPVLQNK
jgi:hypothetical protein